MDRVGVDEFRQSGLAETRPITEEESVQLGEAIGRVSSREVRSHLPLPWFRRSAVDGYALRAADRAERLRVVDKVTAGRPTARRLGPGEAIEITTGAPMPEGADAVALVEESERSGDFVRVREAVEPGSHVSPVGEDIRPGQIILDRDQIVTPVAVAALASQGHQAVMVWRRPRVLIVSTGDELRPLGTPLAHGQVYDVNGAALEALVRAAGGIPVRGGVWEDRYEAVRAGMSALLDRDDWDILVTSGGTGASIPVFQGRDVRELHDLLPAVAAELGTLIHHGIRMSPGRPTALARLGQRPAFLLPGWPYAVLVHFEMLVEPAIRQAAHLPQGRRRAVAARLATSLSPMPGFTWVIQVRVSTDNDGTLWAEPLLPPPPPSASRVMTQMLEADGYIIVEAETDLPQGHPVTVWADPLRHREGKP